MGCTTSRDEISIMRTQMDTLRTRNEQLCSQEAVLAQEILQMTKKISADTLKSSGAVKVLSQLVGKQSQDLDETRVSTDPESIQDYFSSRLVELETQGAMCRQLTSIVSHYQTVIESKTSAIKEELSSLSTLAKTTFAKRLDHDFSRLSLQDTFERILTLCEIEKEMAVIEEDDFASELTKAQECINTQGEVIVVQNKKIRKLMIKQMCVALGNVPSEHKRVAFNLWKCSKEDSVVLTPEKPIHRKKRSLSIRSLNSVSGKTPAPSLSMFRFIEEVFDKKYEQDLKDLTDKKKPMNMTEFLVDYVHKSLGGEKLALDYIGEIVSRLELMHKESHPYAVWLCQVFHLFEHERLPLPLVFYLTRVRIEFHQLVEQFDRALLSRNSKHVSFKSKSNSKLAQRVAEKGGFGFLNDVIDLVISLFAKNKALGVDLLERIRPERISESKYIVYIICNKIKQLGTTPEGVYYLLDKDGTGKIDRKKMIQGIRSLDLWVVDSSIDKLYEKLDKSGTGFFTKDVFLSKFNMNIINALNNSGIAAVSKSSFLIKITEVYMTLFKHDREFLTKMFFGQDFDLEELTGVINLMNSDLSKNAIGKLYREIKDSSPHFKTEDAINRIMEYSVGNISLDVFKIPEFESALIHSLNDN